MKQSPSKQRFQTAELDRNISAHVRCSHITLNEDAFIVELPKSLKGYMELHTEKGAELPFTDITKQEIKVFQEGFNYSVFLKKEKSIDCRDKGGGSVFPCHTAEWENHQII